MGLLVTFVAGLVVWLVLWAIGLKAFDAFMIIPAMVIVAIAARIIAPFLPGNRPAERSGSRWTPR